MDTFVSVLGWMLFGSLALVGVVVAIGCVVAFYRAINGRPDVDDEWEQKREDDEIDRLIEQAERRRVARFQKRVASMKTWVNSGYYDRPDVVREITRRMSEEN